MAHFLKMNKKLLTERLGMIFALEEDTIKVLVVPVVVMR